MRFLRILVLVAVAVVMGGCKDVPVVDPTTPKGDTLKDNMITANRYMNGSEDTRIDGYLSRRSWQAERLSNGVRYIATAPGRGAAIQAGDTVAIAYSVETLAGESVYPLRRDTVVCGRMMPTAGLDAALPRMSVGGKGTVIVPSRQGYGVAGDGDRIRSRMILVYKLRIEN